MKNFAVRQKLETFAWFCIQQVLNSSIFFKVTVLIASSITVIRRNVFFFSLYCPRLFFQYCALPVFFIFSLLNLHVQYYVSLFWTWITLLNTSSRRHFCMVIHAIIFAYVPTEASSATRWNLVYCIKLIHKKNFSQPTYPFFSSVTGTTTFFLFGLTGIKSTCLFNQVLNNFFMFLLWLVGYVTEATRRNPLTSNAIRAIVEDKAEERSWIKKQESTRRLQACDLTDFWYVPSVEFCCLCLSLWLLDIRTTVYYFSHVTFC